MGLGVDAGVLSSGNKVLRCWVEDNHSLGNLHPRKLESLSNIALLQQWADMNFNIGSFPPDTLQVDLSIGSIAIDMSRDLAITKALNETFFRAWGLIQGIT
ncbi:hypothetical protein RhiirA4_430365 [Rhizophagus irregularis]|uniref:Uncharacterized protein n=1 Tax=Rhizophagus irregularis TaxID=588596 RepID=A0A2I1HKG0_9GLOM|nr:hypothetical protein RhiirA4_430365 [Rhizophagus irregularis]